MTGEKKLSSKEHLSRERPGYSEKRRSNNISIGSTNKMRGGEYNKLLIWLEEGRRNSNNFTTDKKGQKVNILDYNNRSSMHQREGKAKGLNSKTKSDKITHS